MCAISTYACIRTILSVNLNMCAWQRGNAREKKNTYMHMVEARCTCACMRALESEGAEQHTFDIVRFREGSGSIVQ